MASRIIGPSLAASLFLGAVACSNQPASTSTTPGGPTPAPTPSVSAITITGSAPTVKSTAELTAKATFTNGTTLDVTSQATWETSNTSVMTVSSHGVVTAVGLGEVDIRATYRSVTGEQHLSITPSPGPDPSPAPSPSPAPDPTPTNCGLLAISPTARNFGEEGPASGAISVTTAADCAWTAASTASFVQINSGAKGLGNGTVSYTVDKNLDTVGRSGSILIGSRIFTVTQDARPPCAVTLSPTAFDIDGRTVGNFPVSAGPALAVTVTMDGVCSWSTATDAPSWLSVGDQGSGSGTLSIRVFQNNTGATRTGVITLAGRSVSVTQHPCVFSLTPSTATVAAAGASLSFVADGSPGCVYNFDRATTFLSVPFQSIGYGGNNTVLIGVPQNPGSTERVETLRMEGRESNGLRTLVATATVTQAGATSNSSASGAPPSSR